MSAFAPFSAIESSKMSAAIYGILPDDVATQVHEMLRSALDMVRATRQETLQARKRLPLVDFSKASAEELEQFVLAMEAREAATKQDRRTAAHLIGMMRKRLRKGRTHLRPAVERLGNTIDFVAVERLELLRDGRLMAIAELESRPQEKIGPVMESSADVKKYLSRLLAA